MFTQDQLKAQVSHKALDFVPEDDFIGVGSGSTVRFFIEALATVKARIRAAVSSSEATSRLLKHYDIPRCELNQVDSLPVYIDGADEINHHLHMIKGGGGALTREKIIGAVAEQFVCIADDSKYVSQLGQFPLPIEVVPMARSYVARQLVALGGRPEWREGVLTDNGNYILDVHGLIINTPVELETTINQIPGVVTCGLFARRHADILLLARQHGVEVIR